MPLAPPNVYVTLLPNLVSAGMLGIGVPQYTQGLTNALLLWNTQIQVVTVDTGTLGAGVGVTPVVVPPTLIYTNLLLAMAEEGLLGPLAPPFLLGVANGISATYLQALAVTAHPMVGTGSAVVRFSVPPTPVGTQLWLQGFKAAGMSGSQLDKKARAFCKACERSFQTITLVGAILGPPNILPSAGVGTGSIL